MRKGEKKKDYSKISSLGNRGLGSLVMETWKTGKETNKMFEGAISSMRSYCKSNDRLKVQERVEKSAFERNTGNRTLGLHVIIREDRGR